MAKQEAKWFKHDQFARRDQKILEMRMVYGAEGYGWWWMLVECMNEASDYKLRISGKYSIPTLAHELCVDAKKLTAFINDCVKEFNLFESDGQFIWSESLYRRMASYEEKVEQCRSAAYARWGKDP